MVRWFMDSFGGCGWVLIGGGAGGRRGMLVSAEFEESDPVAGGALVVPEVPAVGGVAEGGGGSKARVRGIGEISRLR